MIYFSFFTQSMKEYPFDVKGVRVNRGEGETITNETQARGTFKSFVYKLWIRTGHLKVCTYISLNTNK